jgi:hypothetical protein
MKEKKKVSFSHTTSHEQDPQNTNNKKKKKKIGRENCEGVITHQF